MEGKVSTVAKSLSSSPIQELSLLAQRCNAINLAEGFPDFPAPLHIKNAAVSAINSDFNQYRHVQGICDNVAQMMNHMHGLNINPLTDIALCCGQTEAFAAAVFAVIDRGDEVILFDPAYETYEASIIMAGGVPGVCATGTLHTGLWTRTNSRTPSLLKTKVVVLNSPHNPTGKVFTKDELEIVAEACCARDCLAITDEVYEHITYDEETHMSLASFPAMAERTIITSSLSKTYSVTGWRVGWAIAPACIASAIRNIHIKVTDSAPAPFQEAAVSALESPLEYYELLRRDYESRRDLTVNLLSRVGFKVQFKPRGSFFLFVELPENCALSDAEFVEELIKQAGVVAVPGRGFFHENKYSDKLQKADYRYQKRYIRFAFCKSDATLSAAAKKIGDIVDSSGLLELFKFNKSVVVKMIVIAPNT